MQLPYSEVTFKQCEAELKEHKFVSDMKRAVAYYYVRVCAYRGRMNNPVFNISKRLQNVEILERDFRAVLGMFNKEDVFVYADCPYLVAEDYYENVFSEQDHQDLSVLLKAHNGKFVLSSKAKRKLRELYRSNNHYTDLKEKLCREK
jgi:site-specific DNA-adenine methylase